MVTLVLPAYLVSLLPEQDRRTTGARRSLSLQPGSWRALVGELSDRFPLLARRVLPDSVTLANGFVLVINDQVVHGDPGSLDLQAGDEIVIIAAVAGG